jgi:phospholipid/cholesterol/gamma-HCH transport system permease protein
MVMVPVLTVFSGAVAIVAGCLTAISAAELTAFEFFKGVKLHAQAHDFTLPLTKSILFGIAIIMVACYQGINAKGGAEGVGRSATNAAVVSSVLILTLDFVMAMVILR